MSRYVAALDIEWEYFTDKHREIWEGEDGNGGIKRRIEDFINGQQPNPIAIRGPIGQGKTQLLYTAFKFVWLNGGIAFYTTLDKILPDISTTAANFAQQIDFAIKDCIAKLQGGHIKGIPFFTDEMIKFVENNPNRSKRVDKVVFLIDEMERSYAKLLSKVTTDDRSPFGYWLEHTSHFPIAAFAPLSHYEALYGEAEKRRWDSISLPPTTAAALRTKDEEFGNFVWWVSRGRLGIAYKAADSITRKKFTNFNDFKELGNEIGLIAGVPAIDLDNLAKIPQSFSFVIRLFPQNPVTLPSVIEGEIIKSAEFLRLLKDSLKNENWQDRSIEFFGYYLNIVMDALSQHGNIVIPLQKYDEIKALLNIGVDLSIEHETLENLDARYVFEKFNELEEKFPAFFFTRLYPNLQELSEGKGSILSYVYVENLFHMPITSPNFGGFDTIDKAKDVLLSKMTYGYVARNDLETSRGSITFLYFPNEAKLHSYLNSEEMLSFLPPNKGLVCILLDGDPGKINVQGIAGWLKEVQRLRMEFPNKMLANFLTYFAAWVFNQDTTEGLINNLNSTLAFQSEQLWTTDKESGRKVSHYSSMLGAFETSFRDTLELDKEKYSAKASQDSVRRYGLRYERFPDIVAISFNKNKDEHNLIYRFRKLLLDSSDLKSMRSGIGGLLEDASVTRAGLSLALDNIRNDYEKDLHLLLALANEKGVEEEDFIHLSDQTEAQYVLRGVYRYARNDITPQVIEGVKKQIDEIIEAIESLQSACKTIMRNIGIKIRESKSLRNKNQIKELKQLINIVASSSTYCRWLLTEFTTSLLNDFKDQHLHPDQSIRSKWETRSDIAKNFVLKRADINKLDKETFDWFGKTKKEVNDYLTKGYEEAVETLIRYSREVEWENVESLEWSPFEEKVNELVAQVDDLKSINSSLKHAIQLAQTIDDKLARVH
jgi:hypothetical protein